MNASGSYFGNDRNYNSSYYSPNSSTWSSWLSTSSPVAGKRYLSLFWSVALDDSIVCFISFLLDKLYRRQSRNHYMMRYEKLSEILRRDLFNYLNHEIGELKISLNTTNQEIRIRKKNSDRSENYDHENYYWKDFLNLRERKQFLNEIIETAIQLRRMENDDHVDTLNMFKRKSFRIIHMIVSGLYYSFFNVFNVEPIGNLLMMLRTLKVNNNMQSESPTSSTQTITDIPWISQVIKAILRSVIVFYSYDLIDSVMSNLLSIAKANSRTEREREIAKFNGADTSIGNNVFITPQVSNQLRNAEMQQSRAQSEKIYEAQLKLSNILTTLSICSANAKEDLSKSIQQLVEESKACFKKLISILEKAEEWTCKYNSLNLIQAEMKTTTENVIDAAETLSYTLLSQTRELLPIFKETINNINNAVNEVVKTSGTAAERDKDNQTSSINKVGKDKSSKKNRRVEKTMDQYREVLKQLDEQCNKLSTLTSCPPSSDALSTPFYRRESSLNDRLQLFLMNLPIRTLLVYIIDLLLMYYSGTRLDFLPYVLQRN
ncbi:hypothetical protein C9374_010607 [Naegleria lovaniensis]|uniref:Uncharacterized protein n=1 Tax=Naegleria lovaniensis TaxID=51637 RepID=A0AA88GG62_NAELO|nr:uncharacterized protein C9374_010607 [Naegleria lovaniensis]KAG2374588.1 hypothetical protein C9374_010607 [Naegleria lovaniensis]